MDGGQDDPADVAAAGHIAAGGAGDRAAAPAGRARGGEFAGIDECRGGCVGKAGAFATDAVLRRQFGPRATGGGGSAGRPVRVGRCRMDGRPRPPRSAGQGQPGEPARQPVGIDRAGRQHGAGRLAAGCRPARRAEWRAAGDGRSRRGARRPLWQGGADPAARSGVIAPFSDRGPVVAGQNGNFQTARTSNGWGDCMHNRSS